MNRLLLPLAATLVALGSVSAGAGAQATQDVPKDMRPPAGMCRIWLDGVPPAQQPAPTSCPQAVRTRPENGRVIWGDDAAGSRAPVVRSFTEPRKGDESAPPKAQPRPQAAPHSDSPRVQPKQTPPAQSPPRFDVIRRPGW